MKLKYYFMSIALATAALTGFTSCSDDDNDEPADLTLSSETVRVKIGEENRVALPVESGAEVNAFSLDTEVADIVIIDGVCYVEGFKNGNTTVVVSDKKGTYKKIAVSVYTTEVMTLNHTTYNFVTPLGWSSSTTEIQVTAGNGEYTAESDNEYVTVSIDPETGVLTITATSRLDEYTANITVTDVSGLTATITVTVNYTLEAFTENDIEALKAITETTCEYNGDAPYYFYWATISQSTSNGTVTVGGSYGSYAGYILQYPEGTAVGDKVSGTLTYIDWYDIQEYSGEITLIQDDSEKFIATFENVDMDNQIINRGYLVWIK